MTPYEPGTPRSWTQGARSGNMGGDVPVGGGRTFQKAPSLHQALIPLLSKSLTFLETKDSAAGCRHCLPGNPSDLFVSPGSRSEPSFG